MEQCVAFFLNGGGFNEEYILPLTIIEDHYQRLISVETRTIDWFDASMGPLQVFANFSLRSDGVHQVDFRAEAVELRGLRSTTSHRGIF